MPKDIHQKLSTETQDESGKDFLKTPPLTACPTISNSWNWPLSGGTPCTSQLALIRGLLGAVRLSEMACGASVSQTVKLTKGAFLPRGPGDDMPRARKRIKVFLCMYAYYAYCLWCVCIYFHVGKQNNSILSSFVKSHASCTSKTQSAQYDVMLQS